MSFDALIDTLRSIKHDSDRNKALSSLVNVIDIVSNNVPNIISLYSFDSDRNKALDIIVNRLKNINSYDFIETMCYYKFDNDRNKGLLIISKKLVSITPSHFDTLISSYKFDSDRVDAIKIVINYVESFTTEDLFKISRHFKFDSDKAKAMPFLIEKINKDVIKPVININNNIKNNDKKIELFTLLHDLKSLEDSYKLKMIEQNISKLDISQAESRCKELKGHFNSYQIFQNACEILGINPDIQEKVEQTIKIEHEQKVLENELIQIESSFYHKSFFTENENRIIVQGDLSVEIRRRGSCFMIKAQRKGGYTSTSAQLDDKIIIGRSNGNFQSLINNGEVNITI